MSDEDWLIEQVIRIVGAKTVTLESSFQDLGASQVNLDELADAIEDAFDITLTDEDLKSVGKVSDFLDLLPPSGPNVYPG